MRTLALASALALSLAGPVWAGGPVTLESLLKEMADRDAIARFPDPGYTCKQFSSYDRASTSVANEKTWFANGDVNQYLREEDAVTPDGSKRKEWVMADMDGPGAVVRIWSANPKGTMRVYLDGSLRPVIEAPMADALGGKWVVAKPLSEECSKGWNLYLPIPYAKHCKITSDANGFYFQVNYRTYVTGAAVESLASDSINQVQGTLDLTQAMLKDPGFPVTDAAKAQYTTIEPGQSKPLTEVAKGPGAVGHLTLYLDAADLARALRSTVLVGEFDGEQTIWCPIGDFFGQVSGPSTFNDWYRRADGGIMQSLWVMPYAKSAKLSLVNLGPAPVKFARTCLTLRGDELWSDRSMHFHAAWRAEYPIHAYAGRGTQDWNYIDIAGNGVFVGDSLAVMNPVPAWWGEGDEKIYVDGETFPSHFGTGTEDYYGYAWCCPTPFQHPFHSQSRCDGHKQGTNWGYSVVSRVRSLDAIPFAKSFKFDMEVWHWAECDVAYAATTFFYARPGSTTSRKPQPDEASKGPPPIPPPPPPFKLEVPGATTLEAEALKIVGKSQGLVVAPQDMGGFARGKWSGESHLWGQAKAKGEFVELEVPASGPVHITAHATRSWDYGIVRFSIDGRPVGAELDLFSGAANKCAPTGPIDLGDAVPKGGKLLLRIEVVGGNEKAQGSRSFFGLDCLVLTPLAR